MIVEFQNLTVAYGPRVALRDISGGVRGGAVGLLGPNGAGKSTLLRALLGFVRPAAGALKVLDLDVATHPLEVRGRVGYMPEIDAYVPGMNAISFVAYAGELSGLPASSAIQRAHEVLQYVGLGEARYREIATYSTGMKQRAKIAQALVHDPDLLFLDEPTNGMDPRGRQEMLDLISDLAHKKGMNLILSSHLLADVEAVCDDVLVLDRGELVRQGAIAELKGRGGRLYAVRVKGDHQAFVRAAAAAGVDCRPTEGGDLHIFLTDGQAPQTLFQLAAAAGVQIRQLQPTEPTLEDVFAQAVGET